MERISDWKMSGEIWLTRRLDGVDGMDVCRILQMAAGEGEGTLFFKSRRPGGGLGLLDFVGCGC
jgi:hypothetical protein